jgi:DnaK suppressor protein
MDEKRLLYFKKLLQERVNALLDGAEKTVSGMSNDYKEELLDPTDRAALESNRNFTLRIRDRERKLIGKLNEALERIEDGTFGICEMCGNQISEKRLMARPVTTLCIECKTEQETAEKMRWE